MREIAGTMDRSETTVRWHMRHIFAKLGVPRQAELVRSVLALTRTLTDQR